MVVWNFVATHSISEATADLSRPVNSRTEVEDASSEFAGIKSEVTELQKKAEIIEGIDSRIDVASVLAEVSFLINEKVVLSKLWFTAERFADGEEAKSNSGSVVRVAGGNLTGKQALPLGDVRFKVVIGGVASDASDVAELICKLEDSPYFCQVIPSFSRNRKMGKGISPARENFQASEFEIGCYLANYTELTADN